VFQTDGSAKLSAPAFTTSLLLHSAGILLVGLVSFPGSALRQRTGSVVLIAPSLENPAPRFFKAAPKPLARLVRPHRRFESPHEILPKPTLDLRPAPALEPVRIPMPAPAPATEFLPMTPPAIKAAGFTSAANAGVDIVPRRLTSIGGFENATSEETARGANPTRRGGVGPASGFTPESAPPASISAHPEPRASGFGDASVAAPTLSSRRTAGAATAPAEILDKPRPSYTAEARRLNIEGEVLLEVVFEAAGVIKILRVVHGLGHGLDEAAMTATRQIRFRPAQRDGAAIDSSAVVHITFQLAY
jgi:TonB family protein